MNRKLQLLILFGTLLILYGQPGFAQENEAVATPAADTEEPVETTEEPAGQEVEINEDNYRQFMELRDARQQRNALPENAFKPKSGSQKLDDLPEESQKHLRNQLREIIVQGDEWQPGDEGDVYSYVPSEAASTDQSLQKQEAEAWGELVDSYHQREAEIYENATAASAAMGNEGSQDGGAGNSEKPGGEQSGQGQGQGEAGEKGQAGEENRSEQRDAADSYSPNSSRDPNAKSTAGVSQNAMEFLKGMGKQNGTGEGTGTAGDGEGAGQQQASQEQMQANQDEPASQAGTAEGNPQNSADTESTAGTSQNALDYLQQSDAQGNSENEAVATTYSATGGDGQSDGEDGNQGSSQGLAGEQSEEETISSEISISENIQLNPTDDREEISTQGTAQNALEYLTGDTVENAGTGENGQEPIESEGTLSIQDLLNAQGVGAAVGTTPSSNNDTDESDPDKDKKDGDG